MIRCGVVVVTEFRVAWRDETSPVVRRMLIASVLFGLGLLVVGSVGDFRGWWASIPYLTNVLTGLTGAMFGVPFAVLFLARVARHQADEAERRGVQRLLSTATAALADGTSGLLKRSASRESLKELLFALENLGGAARLGSAGDGAGHGGEWERRSLPNLTERQRFRDEAAKTAAAFGAVRGMLTLNFGSAVEIGRVWAEICGSWKFLSGHVRPRLIEVELQWPADGLVPHLDKMLQPDDPPLLRLLELKEGQIDEYVSLLTRTAESAFQHDFPGRHADVLVAERVIFDTVDHSITEVNELLGVLETLDQVQVAGVRSMPGRGQQATTPPALIAGR